MTEQELIDFALDQAVPALQDLTDIEANTSELLELYKAEIAEKEELQKQEELQAKEEAEALLLEEETGEMEVMSVESTEEEVIIDYDPLLLEQLEILNAHMEVSQDLQNKGNQINAETAMVLVITIAIAIAVKTFVDQVTKW